MEIKQAGSRPDLAEFFCFPQKIYKNNPFYRSTEDDLVKLIVAGPTCFHNHAEVLPFLAINNGEIVARFALIQDKLLPEYVQVSFFEAQPGLKNLLLLITERIKLYFPDKNKFIIGLDGHLNYGAGFLLNHYDEVPLFGLPYSMPYYVDYFGSLHQHRMVSFRFPVDKQHIYLVAARSTHNIGGLTIRKIKMKKLKDEIKIYTYLNNVCFQSHPFWSNRSWEEDYEMFYPFRHLFNEENLLFLEKDDRPIGFLLWYPDFNQLVSSRRYLNAIDVLKYKLMNPIRTLRFTEIGIIPEYRRTPAVLALIQELALSCVKNKYDYCEAGFIFRENRGSMRMTKRYLERITGQKIMPYRNFAIYEGAI